LVVPKGEYVSFDDFAFNASSKDISHFFKTVQKICDDLKIAQDGYRIMCNIGKNGMQMVPHMHLHILGGKMLGRTNP
jgi:diadenosine tetraphosphate (Ap4A) HIT family hydrolase